MKEILENNADMTSLYAVIGVVVVAQFGTVMSMVIWLLKATWKASEMNSDIKRLKADVNAAHNKLRLKNDDEETEQ